MTLGSTECESSRPGADISADVGVPIAVSQHDATTRRPESAIGLGDRRAAICSKGAAPE
jgi:hypothetical protein